VNGLPGPTEATGATDSGAGIIARLGPWVALGAILLPLLGYVYAQGRAIEGLNGRLDRNCRILAVVQANTRYIIIEHTATEAQADVFREIFNKALVDSCGA
jgi:hypothetical protein